MHRMIRHLKFIGEINVILQKAYENKPQSTLYIQETNCVGAVGKEMLVLCIYDLHIINICYI